VWQAAQNGTICVRYPIGSWPPAVRPDRNLVAPGDRGDRARTGPVGKVVRLVAVNVGIAGLVAE
jgi:hypothetical protein